LSARQYASVAAVAFALLGIEGAATECENPFSPKRFNQLGMDRFCEAAHDEMCQLLRWWREEEEEGEQDDTEGTEGGGAGEVPSGPRTRYSFDR